MEDWSAIVKTHGPAVWQTVFRLLGTQSDAQDCYQDTFLVAYQSATRQSVRHWRAYLVSLATRRAMDHLRRKIRDRNRFAPLDAVREPAVAEDSAIEAIQRAERLDQVRAILADLPPKQAEVFWLGGVEELAPRAIAEQLDLNPGEVRVLLHRARLRLRAALVSVSSLRGVDR